jgi:hypothetical protein
MPTGGTQAQQQGEEKKELDIEEAERELKHNIRTSASSG